MSGAQVRAVRSEDAEAMAHVHVDSWRETYRGVMPDRVLDDPGMLEMRRRFWATVLADPRFEGTTAVAEEDGRIVGIALAGPTPNAEEDGAAQLYVLYLLHGHHGSGLGRGLLDAVLDDERPATLWVADPNPRAQAFYRKAGFTADGEEKVEDGVRELRMIRAAGGASRVSGSPGRG
jgi:GNAT superfamily N-acetyltransferase